MRRRNKIPGLNVSSTKAFVVRGGIPPPSLFRALGRYSYYYEKSLFWAKKFSIYVPLEAGNALATLYIRFLLLDIPFLNCENVFLKLETPIWELGNWPQPANRHSRGGGFVFPGFSTYNVASPHWEQFSRTVPPLGLPA